MRFEREINIYGDEVILKRFTANETSISVIQGEISAIISESELIELIDSSVTMYSKLASAIMDIDSLTINFSDLTTKYNTVSGQYTALDSKVAEYKASVDGLSANVSQISQNLTNNYSTTTAMNSAINLKINQFSTTVSETYATKSQLNNYSTTAQMNSAIKQKADEISTSVSATYATKTSVTTAQNNAVSTAKDYTDSAKASALTTAKGYADDAEAAANANTANRLKSYSTTAQMNSAINQKANEINASVSATYATKSALNTANGKIDDLEEWKSEASLKITDSAIISTVISSSSYENSVESLIEQNADSIRLKADRISWESTYSSMTENGILTCMGARIEGDGSGEEDGTRILIENANYTLQTNSRSLGFFGFKNMGNSFDNYKVPKLAMGAYGYASSHNYFGIVTYKGNGDNPQESDAAYVDIFYHNIATNDYSNIKMYDGGDMRIAPVRNLEITSNYVNASYEDMVEHRIALFSTSTLSSYNSNLQIGAIANHSNGNGLVLADRYRDMPWGSDTSAGASKRTIIRIQTDSSGNKFVRPFDGNGDIELGSASFPFQNVVTKSGSYSSSGVYVSAARSLALNEITAENVLDNIFVYPPVQTYNSEENSNEDGEELILDITNIKDTHYVEMSDEGIPYMRTDELLKLLIMEVKKLKEESLQFKQSN